MKLLQQTTIMIVLLLFVTNIQAQVTIGHDSPPINGSLLQLKENDNSGTNSTKGLILPRIQLTGHNLDPFSTADSDTPEMYTGLTVWNVRGVGDICKGVQVWSGSKWVSSMPEPKDQTAYNAVTGILTDHEGNTYRTASFSNTTINAGIWMTENLRSRRAPHSCDDVYYAAELSNDDFRYNMYLQIMLYPNGSLTGVEAIPPTWTKEQGMLYSWALATNNKGGEDGNGNVDNPAGAEADERENQPIQRQGICPDGWHLPSFSEWEELFQVLEQDATSNADKYGNYDSQVNTPLGARGGGTTARSNIKLGNNPAVTTNGASKTTSQGGFDALPTGYKSGTSSIGGFGSQSDFWTASASSAKDVTYDLYLAYSVMIKHNYSSLISDNNINTMLTSRSKRTGLYSVRCKKND